MKNRRNGEAQGFGIWNQALSTPRLESMCRRTEDLFLGAGESFLLYYVYCDLSTKLYVFRMPVCFRGVVSLAAHNLAFREKSAASWTSDHKGCHEAFFVFFITLTTSPNILSRQRKRLDEDWAISISERLISLSGAGIAPDALSSSILPLELNGAMSFSWPSNLQPNNCWVSNTQHAWEVWTASCS